MQGAPAAEQRLEERELELGHQGERIDREKRRLGLKYLPAEPDLVRSGRAEAQESEGCLAGFCPVEQQWCLFLLAARSLRRLSWVS